MKAVFNIFSKTLVKQFYIANTGFFLFWFFFFFGIVKSGYIVPYHKSLMLAMITSPVWLMIVMLGWLGYNIKCIAFCSTTIQSATGSFLYNCKALSAVKQWSLYLFSSFLLYLPVFVYACLVAAMAVSKSLIAVAIAIAVFQLLMIALGAVVLYTNINSNKTFWLKKLLFFISAHFRIKIGYFGFLLSYLLNAKKVAFIVLKISCLLILSVSFIRNADAFDKDLFSIFFQIIMVAHAAIVFYCVDFNETLLLNNRNLPLPWIKVAGMYLLTWCVILLPETAFMLVNNHGNLPISEIVMLSLTAMGILLLYTGMAYGSRLKMEQYQLFIFIGFILFFFLQKSGLHLLVMTGTIALALAVFKAHYFSFEKEA